MIERIRRAGQVSWAVMGLAAVVALLGIVAWYFRVIFPPLILAGAIVFILNPVVSWFQRRGIHRLIGTTLTYLSVAGIAVGIGFAVAPLAQSQADDLADEWPELRADVEDWINEQAEKSERDDWPIKIPTVEELEDELGGGDDQSFDEQLDRVRELGLRVFHVLLILILAPIIAFYLLVDLPNVRRAAESLIPERSKDEVLVVARRLNRAIGGYFRGQLLVALIVGIMVSIGLAIIDLPFWLLIGMIAGVFNMIPLIGPYIGGIPGVIIALTTRDVGTALWVVVVMVIAQQIDNHFITPNVMQRVVKLHPAAVMLALLAGGTLGGFLGLLLAVPIAAVLKIIVGHLWRTYVLGEPIEELAALYASEDAEQGGVVEDVTDDEPRPAPAKKAAARKKAAPRKKAAATKKRSGAAAPAPSRRRAAARPSS